VTPRLHSIDDEGWFEWLEPPAGRTRIFVRIEEAADGRQTLGGVRIEGHVSADLLRSIPIGRIEAAANALLHPDASPPTARRRSARIAATLRANAVQGYPDTFYDAVATAYRHLVTRSSSPIADLATANDVPVTTAQRWVREARRRGKLPPGRAGKAG
jgi:Arc/MetJ family transcription regulator